MQIEGREFKKLQIIYLKTYQRTRWKDNMIIGNLRLYPSLLS